MADDVRIHDWTRVDAGTWHDFHYAWFAEIRRVLNLGVLPEGYYANAERRISGVEPDVLALEEASHELVGDDGDGGVATATAPPKLAVSKTAIAYPKTYRALQLRVVVRHESGNRVVAYFELTSPANKDRRASVEAFTEKAHDAIVKDVHLSLVDLFPPRRHDTPGGLVGSVADAVGCGDIEPPTAKPLMIGAFDAARPPVCYAEPLAVGDALPDLPIFLRPGFWVPVPLASTYAAAWEATPKRWRKVIEGEA